VRAANSVIATPQMVRSSVAPIQSRTLPLPAIAQSSHPKAVSTEPC
jgi:hypothetical protein